MNARDLLSRYEQWFPPMYREDRGISYTLSVFVSRVALLVKVCAAITIAFVVIWFLGQNSILGIYQRLAIVAVTGFGGWQLFKLLRHFNREAAERRLNPSPDITAEDSRELAQLVGGAWMVMAAAGLSEPDRTSPDEPAIQRVIGSLIHKRTGGKPINLSSEGGKSGSPVFICVEGAFELQLLMNLSKSRLVLEPEKKRGVVSVTARSRLIEALRREDVFVEFEKGKRRRPSLNPIVEIIGIGGTGAEPTIIDPTIAVDSVARWLESIHVSVSDRDPLAWIER